ncbi:MAG: TrmB family transcriptional regulator [Anaerolineae bacterium]|nr:TrmB family transcriptional regulator [Anaerolineae bacterium]
MDLQTALVAVGFTEYEARVYIALLDAYPDTGYQISKRSGVPRSMVYEALGRLKNRGAVLETRESRGLLYRPLPPDVLLDRHEAEQRRLLDGLRRGLCDLFEASDDDRVWSLNGSPVVLAYAARLIRRADSELLLVLGDADLATLLADIRAACARGVRVGTLLTGSGTLAHSEALDCGEVAHHPPLESELQELSGTLLVVADGAEALIANAALGTTATVTTNRNLVMISRQFVWMELFTQRVYAQLGPDLLAQLDPQDRQIFESHHDSGR